MSPGSPHLPARDGRLRRRARAVVRLAPLGLTGCGYLVRVEAGPTFQGDDQGATGQVTLGWSPIAGSGVYELLVVGGYGTALTSGVAGGLFLGVDAGVAPGGVDQPRDEETHLGGSLRFHPRIGTDGVALGGGAGVAVGKSRQVGHDAIDFGGHEKSSLSIGWDERAWTNVTVAADLQKVSPLQAETWDRWRLDLLIGVERMVLAD